MDAQSRSTPHLVSHIISPALKQDLQRKPADEALPIIVCLIESKEDPGAGIRPAKEAVKNFVRGIRDYDTRLNESDFYVFASLRAADIFRLAELHDHVYQIWRDDMCSAHLIWSVDTLKATACWRTFDARGKGITWAMLDTGIAYDHPHFAAGATVDRQLSKNFSVEPSEEDLNGHGTHVAGIIAGAAPEVPNGPPCRAAMYIENDVEPQIKDLDGRPSGVAPLAKLVNLKVLDRYGNGPASASIRALEYVRKVNESSRTIRIAGANLSLGYPFDPKVYGCGHSPLCDEIRRTVGAGVIIVVSCGNAGYGVARLDTQLEVPVSIGLSIDDPANAESAIAVGSCHKTSPHKYGVSYFSSKGPTGDGRMKPDLVAPGEKIVSCSLHWRDTTGGYAYEERSGTSMAAPHVSGAIAAFLSFHREFIGDPDGVKAVFRRSASDLGRDPAFQGAGFIDLLKAVSSV